jgi:hypothetical protein
MIDCGRILHAVFNFVNPNLSGRQLSGGPDKCGKGDHYLNQKQLEEYFDYFSQCRLNSIPIFTLAMEILFSFFNPPPTV